jgi:hypothetical protein
MFLPYVDCIPNVSSDIVKEYRWCVVAYTILDFISILANTVLMHLLLTLDRKAVKVMIFMS